MKTNPVTICSNSGDKIFKEEICRLLGTVFDIMWINRMKPEFHRNILLLFSGLAFVKAGKVFCLRIV